MKLKFNIDKQEWEQVDEKVKGEDIIYLDGFLKAKLDNIKGLQKKNWDTIFIICGPEGAGKSTLSFSCGQYISNMSLGLGNIASGSDDAMNKLRNLPDGSILIVDEAELLFSSRETMTKEQRQLTKIFMIIRQKKMVLILVCPSFFDLSKYIAIDRSRFLLRAYPDNRLNRGAFAYWGQKKKAKLYTFGKKRNGSYARPKPDFYGRFVDYKLPFNEEYLKVKMASLSEAFDGTKKKEVKDIEPAKRDELMVRLKRINPKISHEDLGVAFELDPSTVSKILKEREKKLIAKGLETPQAT